MNLVCPSEKNENDTKLQKLVIRLNNKSAAIQNIIQGTFYNQKLLTRASNTKAIRSTFRASPSPLHRTQYSLNSSLAPK